MTRRANALCCKSLKEAPEQHYCMEVHKVFFCSRCGSTHYSKIEWHGPTMDSKGKVVE